MSEDRPEDAQSAGNGNGGDQPPDIVPDDPASGSDGGSDDDEVERSRAPLLSHLVELRRRLIVAIGAVGVGFIICFIFSQQLYDLLTVPYIEALRDRQLGEAAVLNYKPLELFFARVKLAMIAGLMASFPIIARELYMFVAPGLYSNERRAIYPFLVAIPFLFAAGLALVYFLVMPFVITFALSMQTPPDTGAAVTYNLFVFVGDYLSLIMTLCIAFGFAFQLPIVLVLLAMAGIVDAKGLRKFRRYAIVIIFVFGAVLTPPDPFSQIALGVVLIGLYEASIIAVRLVQKRGLAEDRANAE